MLKQCNNRPSQLWIASLLTFIFSLQVCFQQRALAASPEHEAASRGNGHRALYSRTKGELVASVPIFNYAREPGDVRRYGISADGVVDVAPVIQKILDSGVGEVVFPSGIYRFGSPLRVPNGTLLRGQSLPGTANGNASQSVLRHDFEGDFIIFDGSAGTNRGSGGGLENLIIEQYYGFNGSPRGRAVIVTGSNVDLRANWVRIKNCQIENAIGRDNWTWGIDIDGRPVGGKDGVRGMWIESTRVVGDSTGGAVRILNAFNIWLIGVETNLAGSDIVISSDPGSMSASVHLVGTTAVNLEIDRAQYIHVTGGSYTSIRTTDNTDTAILMPSFVSWVPPKMLGTNIVLFGWDDSKNVMAYRATTETALRVGRDEGAGDSTESTQVVVGNLAEAQGEITLRYTNAPAYAGPVMGIYALPRNTRDTSNFDGGALRWEKVPGTDRTQVSLSGTGGQMIIHNGGYITFDRGIGLKTHTDETRPDARTVPQGTMIWNITDHAPNFSDGEQWRDSAGEIAD